MVEFELAQLPFDDIELSFPGFKNCRSSLGDVSDLRQSIETNGHMTPLTIWEVEKDKKTHYVLVNGFRRYEAIRLLREDDETSFTEVNVAAFKGSLDDAITINGLENLKRDDLNPMDAADFAFKMYERLGTQDRVAQALSMSQPWVHGAIKLKTDLCSRAQESLRTNKITLKQAKALTNLVGKDKKPDEEKQHALLDKIEARREEKIESPEKKERSIRSKDELLAMRKRLVDVDDDDIEAAHKESVNTTLRWYFKELDDDQVMVRQPMEEVKEAAAPAPKTEDAPTKKRQPKVKAPEEAPAEPPAVAEEPPKKRLLGKKKEA